MKVHCIGIGGIGVSALAKYYLEKGYQVSGSDLVSSEITEALKKLGAKIFIGKHEASCLNWEFKYPDLIIYSPAVQLDNPELKEAKKLGIECLSYPQALGELTRKYWTIAISGTHGKSTTVAMTALILMKAGLDPTVIIGTKLKEFDNSNCRVGKSKYLVIEADEWQASFLRYFPQIIVLTNIEREHLDFYKNLNHILKTYKKYISHLPKDGILVVNDDDDNISRLLEKYKKQVSVYSLTQKEAKKLKKILKIPGEHNIYNALAALTVARALKIPDRTSYTALSEYKGSWRRFEIIKGKIQNTHTAGCKIQVINDYAHHPTEVRATLKAARSKFPKREIWCVFQPHQYQRTYYLFNDFVKVFSEALVDRLIITDIYDVTGRETPKTKKRVSSKKLVQAINKQKQVLCRKQAFVNHLCTKVEYIPEIKETAKYLKRNLRGEEVVIIMGAGDIYRLAEFFHLTKISKRQKIR